MQECEYCSHANKTYNTQICHKCSGRRGNSQFKLAEPYASAPEMLEALEAVAETDEPCYYDHHGLCQTHKLRTNGKGEPECEMKLVRAAIAKVQGE